MSVGENRIPNSQNLDVGSKLCQKTEGKGKG